MPAIRIKANHRLASIASHIEDSILAVLHSHGLTVVREADTQHYDEARVKEFAKECGRNAMAIVALNQDGAL